MRLLKEFITPDDVPRPPCQLICDSDDVDYLREQAKRTAGLTGDNALIVWTYSENATIRWESLHVEGEPFNLVIKP